MHSQCNFATLGRVRAGDGKTAELSVEHEVADGVQSHIKVWQAPIFQVLRSIDGKTIVLRSIDGRTSPSRSGNLPSSELHSEPDKQSNSWPLGYSTIVQ